MSKNKKREEITMEDIEPKNMSERITIWMPLEITTAYRERAKAEGTKYQTLMKKVLEAALNEPAKDERFQRIDKNFHAIAEAIKGAKIPLDMADLLPISVLSLEEAGKVVQSIARSGIKKTFKDSIIEKYMESEEFEEQNTRPNANKLARRLSRFSNDRAEKKFSRRPHAKKA